MSYEATIERAGQMSYKTTIGRAGQMSNEATVGRAGQMSYSMKSRLEELFIFSGSINATLRCKMFIETELVDVPRGKEHH